VLVVGRVDLGKVGIAIIQHERAVDEIT
jgi:hypothetical protein